MDNAEESMGVGNRGHSTILVCFLIASLIGNTYLVAKLNDYPGTGSDYQKSQKLVGMWQSVQNPNVKFIFTNDHRMVKVLAPFYGAETQPWSLSADNRLIIQGFLTTDSGSFSKESKINIDNKKHSLKLEENILDVGKEFIRIGN